MERRWGWQPLKSRRKTDRNRSPDAVPKVAKIGFLLNPLPRSYSDRLYAVGKLLGKRQRMESRLGRYCGD
jgi:hypothetical protein